MKADLIDIQTQKEEQRKQLIDIAKENKTPPWTMDQLETVLNHLKKNKSQDPFGFPNEIFHTDVAGDDLKKTIHILMNRIKFEQIFPEFLEICNISSIYKLKGRRNDSDSYRGIFS